MLFVTVHLPLAYEGTTERLSRHDDMTLMISGLVANVLVTVNP